jgi:hypothetical protein
LALASASCGRDLYPVSGKVTYQGAPAAGATVFFYRKGGNSMNEHLIMGIVQGDGTFELVCGSLGKGALPGDYDVLIQWKPVIGQGRGRPQRGPDTLRERFADRQHPRLQAKVEKKANHLPPFELADAEPLPKK